MDILANATQAFKNIFKHSIFIIFALQMSLHSGCALNPLKAEFFYMQEPFDFTKQGNVYEKHFTMPLDLWRHNPHIAIQIFFKPDTYWRDNYPTDDDSDIRVAFENLPIKNGADFIKRLDYIWRPANANKFAYGCRPICHWDDLQKQKVLKILQSHHPNQYFKFKLIFTPLSNPKFKQEQIIEFPLYFTFTKGVFPAWSDEGIITLALFDTKVWGKYSIRLEALENAPLPSCITPHIIITGAFRK